MLARMKRAAVMAAAGLAGALVIGMANAALTPFQTDVETAINNGLAFLATDGAFTAPVCKTACSNNAGYAVGLTTLALLEKRASGNPSDPPQGYSGASSADQTRLRGGVAAILSDYYTYYLFASSTPKDFFYAYFDGSSLSALTEYIASGGPETCGPAPNPNSCAAFPGTPPELQGFQMSVQQAIDAMVDVTLENQRTPANGYANDYQQGYWHYTAGDDTDSSTTQFAALGLAAAQALYNNPAFGDPGSRLPKIAAALSLARQAYELNAEQGSPDAACDNGFTFTSPNPASYPAGFVPNPRIILNNGGGATTALVPTDPNAYGHGYHSSPEGYPPSLQQTASGLFVQALGGANINDPMVQGYMRWVNDHYRYTDNGSLNGAGELGWGYDVSYFYYLWASFKGIEFLTQQGIVPNAGNLTTSSYGTTPGASAPVCTDRQVHLDPNTVKQVPAFGSGAAGYYSAESQSLYFDYAYMILSYQCGPTTGGAAGEFACASTSGFGSNNPGSWVGWDADAYSLLVLQRATGVLAPTATLVASAATAAAGTSVTLTWGSANANSCAATGGTAGDGWTGSSLATSGSLPVKETVGGTYTYTITCSAGSQSAQAQVQVTFTGAMMCDIAGASGMSPDGEVSMYDIKAMTGLLNQLTQPAGPAPDNADPMGAGKVTEQDIRTCVLRCTHANCAN